MKYWCEKALLRAQLVVVAAAVAFSIPAFAQFEIAPDHFDSNPPAAKKQAVKSAPKKSQAPSAALAASQDKGQAGSAAKTTTTRTGTAPVAGQTAASRPAATKAARKKQAASTRKRDRGKVTVASSR